MKKIILFTVFIILLQIVITFLTENQIVTNSFNYHQNYLVLNQLKSQNQILSNQYLESTSLTRIKQQISALPLVPISKILDLTK